ncbi:DUF159 family protein [Jeongeupia sp. HS-3]|nr:DUF159 family protein [Jeongeupia sp. HS-3]
MLGMCVNFIPAPRPTFMPHFQMPAPLGDWPDEVWQDYAAPIMIAGEQGHETLLASYGMVPKRKMPPDIKPFSTMNARAETLGQLKSYRTAWAKAYRCLVPMLAFFEPCYESGKAERWRIGRQDGEPFAVAGIWRPWRESDGAYTFSFSQITINADAHPLMRRMHKPQDEKRSLVVVPESDYADWLNCTPEAVLSLLRPFPADTMRAQPEPRMTTRKISNSGVLF